VVLSVLVEAVAGMVVQLSTDIAMSVVLCAQMRRSPAERGPVGLPQ